MAVIAVGRRLPGFGSWDWIGADLCREIGGRHTVVPFDESPPECDVVLIIKHTPARQSGFGDTPLVYLPVDSYGSAAAIDRDARFLRQCSRVVVHAEPLRKYFASYAPVDYLDHHVKFVTSQPVDCRADGPILWVGVRTNLPPLVDWFRQHGLPERLLVLTNPEDESVEPKPCDFGFPDDGRVKVERWSRKRHVAALQSARAAIDVKGDDFRSRHKPPAKAIDFIASGLPLAVNSGHPARSHLAKLGFELADVGDTESWLSKEYWEETVRFGGALKELLQKERVGRRLRGIIESVLKESRTC